MEVVLSLILRILHQQKSVWAHHQQLNCTWVAFNFLKSMIWYDRNIFSFRSAAGLEPRALQYFDCLESLTDCTRLLRHGKMSRGLRKFYGILKIGVELPKFYGIESQLPKTNGIKPAKQRKTTECDKIIASFGIDFLAILKREKEFGIVDTCHLGHVIVLLACVSFQKSTKIVWLRARSGSRAHGSRFFL